jgi:pyruvate formate-lyase activating enzyme-like uncharacterized protein
MADISDSDNASTMKHGTESGDAHDRLKYVSPDEAGAAKAYRQAVFEELALRIEFKNKRTKAVHHSMSPGCELCGSGSWSCLFINGKCNCRCFYCPAEQRAVGLPTTNTLAFPKAQDYADYIEQLDFKGVSVSGGEPLLTLDATLKFITAVKKRFGKRIYLWMYTNGTLVDAGNLSRLKDAGLDEIRFDIGATEYSLKKARMAVGVIDHVTVEIPAIPEDEALLKDKLHEMCESGISFLNLHQLRLTAHNRSQLMQRRYTYLHGEHPTVLESELTVLRLLRHAAVNRLPLGINYCSFVYKNRFQKAAARRRCSLLICKPHEDVTENGYIRSLYLKGPSGIMASTAAMLSGSGCRPDAWRLTKEKDRLFFNAAIMHLLPAGAGTPGVSYSDSRLVSSISYRNPFKEIQLNRNRSIFAERARASEDMDIPQPLWSGFAAFLDGGEDAGCADAGEPLGRILRFERIEAGLQDYA